jgi:hypothetical protein
MNHLAFIADKAEVWWSLQSFNQVSGDGLENGLWVFRE